MTGAVLLLCDYQAPYGGNFIASLRALEGALADRGVKTVYLLPEGALARQWCERLQETGSAVEGFDPGARPLALAKRVRNVAKRYGASIVHVHFGKYAASAVAALLLPKLRLVWHYHSDFSAGRAVTSARRARLLLRGAFIRLMGRRVVCVAVSPHVAAALPGARVISNALAPDRLVDRHAGRSETRAALGLTDEDALVLLFGWSPLVKGVDLAVEAVALLRTRGVRAVLGLVGGREYPPDRMREWIASHTRCTGEEPFLLHLPPTEDVFAYHEASDVMLSASRSEAFPYSLLEAVHTLRPCVVTDIPGAQYLAGCPTAFFARADDAAAIADALQCAIAFAASPESAALLQQAKCDLANKHPLDRWIGEVLDVYLSFSKK